MVFYSNKSFKRIGLISIFLFFLIKSSNQVFAQSPEIKFNYLTRENGLSNNSILSIYQDSKGYMWFGSEDGLNRYDGYKITIYKNNPTIANSISSNNINCILEDRKHRIWVATNYGLNVYNRASDQFTRYLHVKGRSNTINNNIIFTINEDADGKIWIGTKSGLSLFNEKNQTFKNFVLKVKLEPNALDNSVKSIFIDKKGRILVGTDGAGIQQFDKNTGKFTFIGDTNQNFNVLRGLRISTIIADRNNNLWIGTTGNGVFLYNTLQNTIKNFTKQQLIQPGLTINVIKTILCDHENNIWIGTENGGINLWQPKTGTFLHYENNPQKISTISQKSVAYLFEDKQYNIWVGTLRGGVNIYSPNANIFKKYTQGYLPGDLTYKDVKAFYEDTNGEIWVGTDGGGINILNPITDRFRQYRFNPNNPSSIGSDEVLQIFKDHKGTIWVAAWSGGLNRYEKASGTFTRFLHDPANKNSISSNNVFRIYEDRNHSFWIATFYGGLNLFDPLKQTFTRIIDAPDGKSHFLGNNVISIEQDHEGNLWFGTDDNGLNFLSADKQHFVNYFSGNQNDLTDAVKTVYCDSKNRVWVGKTGLYLFNKRKKNFSLFSSDPSLVNDKIAAILEDNKGNLWISTNNGLIEFNPDTKYLKKFTDADGLQGLDFCQNACLKTRAGKMYFGGFQGFNEFNPDSIKNNKYSYPVYITGLLLFNKNIQKDSSTSQIYGNISELQEISLDYSQSVFSLEYAALNYVSPAKTQYAYWLQGFDKGWNYVGSKREATYTNLDPGTYFFYVKASSPDGSWDSQPAMIKVIVKPPFWMTWWFRLITVSVFFGIILLFIYYQRKTELQKFHEKKSEEMHQMQLQFFTNISHEFRTPLTLILGTLEQILKKTEGSVFTSSFFTIQRNANRLMHLISELMDFRKTETGALKLKVMEGDFSLFLKEIVREFKEQSQAYQMELLVSQEKDFNHVWFDRQVIEKIILNLINNSFKYNVAGGNIQINIFSSGKDSELLYKNSIKIEHEYKGQNYIYVSVTDSGIGISEESIGHLFDGYYRVSDDLLGSGIGLPLVKSLTLLHKGKLFVYSEEKKGTQMVFAFPCNKTDYRKEEIWSENSEVNTALLESIQYKNLLYRQLPEVENKQATVSQTSDKYRILIVDDNDELRSYFKIILEPAYQVIEAENGKVGMIKAKNESPALIISDVMMPEMDGIDFCSNIKDDFETSHIPFILLTAKDAMESRIEGMESGADYYFSKPVSTDLLLLTIKNLFKQIQKTKEHYLKDYRVEVRDLVHSEKDKNFMNQLLNLIEQKLEDPELNVDFVCREIGISKSKLYKKITDITGQSINKFIRTIRLKKSIEIMTNEDVLITEVMYRVGFLSQSYYTSIFKKEFGMTPTQFQQQLNSKSQTESKK